VRLFAGFDRRRFATFALASTLTGLTGAVAAVLIHSIPRVEAAPDSAAQLLSSVEPFDARLEFALADLKARSRTSPDATVTGSLSFVDPATGQPRTIDGVTVSTRGHTSQRESECDFPKLKLKFGRAQSDAAFAGIKTLKIGTHCGERADGDLTPKFGRWANDKAPWREAAVYKLLEALQVPTLEARPVRLTYVDTQAGGQPAPLTRKAFFLEDDRAAMERLNGVAEQTESQFTSARERFAESDAARLAFTEALVGNFDWCVRFYQRDTYRCDPRHSLWNVLAFTRTDATDLPVPYDFDISGMVTGGHLWFHSTFGRTLGTDASAKIAIEVLSQVERTRSLFSRATLDQTRAAFNEHKSAAYDALSRVAVDEEGRSTIKEYLDNFFGVIESDDAFYRPVVARANTPMWLDANATRTVCGSSNTVPVGTMVNEVVETRGGLSRVRLLDVLWQWTDARRCDIVHNGPVWIPTASISTNYPSSNRPAAAAAPSSAPRPQPPARSTPSRR